MEEKLCTYPGSGYPDAPRKEGIFLRFADTIFFDDGNNPHGLTVALVRTSEGKVLELAPRDIVFKV